MTARSRLVATAVLIGAALLLAPARPAGFRSEDFLDYDRYARVGLGATLTGPHLGFTMVTFWRPLGDAATWLVVRGIGTRADAVHLLLVGLVVLAALSAARMLRELFGARDTTSIAGALLVVVHPFAPAVTTYLDGGLSMSLAAIATFQALAALGRWRAARGGLGAIAGWTLAALLAHDAAVIVPAILAVIAMVLPRGARSSARPVLLALLLVPLLLGARWALLGKAFDGYGGMSEPGLGAKLAAFPERLATTSARMLVPVFPGTVHGPSAGWGAWGALAGLIGVAAGLSWLARRTAASRGAVAGSITAAPIDGGGQAAAGGQAHVGAEGHASTQAHVGSPTPVGGDVELDARASRIRALRRAAAALLLVVGLVGMAAEFFVMAPPAPPDELVLAYKTWPAAIAAASAIAWLLGAASAANRFAALVLALGWLGVSLSLRAPIAAAHDEALRWGRELPASLELATRERPDVPVLVLEVPLKSSCRGPDGERPVTRAFQYGLSSALRPPFVARERFVYPLFRVEDGLLAWFAPETVDAFAACPWLEPLQCRLAPPAGVVPIERPRVRASELRLVASADAPDLTLRPDLSNAPIVLVRAEPYTDEQGRPRSIDVIELAGASLPTATVPGANPPLSLALLNRMHFAKIDLLHRAPGSDGLERIYFSSPWLREIATRFPDDLVFAVLQACAPQTTPPGPVRALETSNVIAFRLRIEEAR